MLLILIVGVGVTAVVMSNSWWTDTEHTPSPDQVAADGTSTFTQAGVDYLNAAGVVIIKVRPDSLGALELGLDIDGSRNVEGLTPLELRLLGNGGVLNIDLVDSFTVTTSGGDISRVEMRYAGNGNYRDLSRVIAGISGTVGWSVEDVAQMEDELTAARRESTGDSYSAQIQSRDKSGMQVSAIVEVNVATSSTSLMFVAQPLES